MISKLSRIAANGNQPSHAERDLHVVLGRISNLHMAFEEVDVRMWNHKESKIMRTKIPVLMPDKLAAAIWSLGEETFQWFFLGDMSRDDVEQYWNHVYMTSDWFRAHPAATYPRSGLVPLSLYGDEVCTYKGTEVGTIMVLAWTSDFTYKRSPFMRYLLLTAYSEYIASDHTYDDIMTAVCERITLMVDINKKFPWSHRFNFMFSSNQGDLKFMLYKHHLFAYNSNDMCSLCGCVKSDPAGRVGMTVGDFRSTALHRSTLVSHEDYMARTSPAQRLLF